MRLARSFLRYPLLACAVIAPIATSAWAADKVFSDTQTKAMEEIIHNYLVTHPEVLVEAMDALDKKQAEAKKAETRAVIADNAEMIYGGPTSFVAGNPNGDVSVVEFFDYQCGFCRRNFPHLNKAVAKDGNIRLVLKEWPILGPVSQYAAKAALAARAQGKYLEFHNALYQLEGELTNERILDTAARVGLDLAQLKKDMDNPAVEAVLRQNYALSQKLGFTGTPTFIIGKDVYSGLQSEDEIAAHVAAARAECGTAC